MADWILIACLRRLVAEFDAIAPNRDHASDGSIGDAAHQAEVSDHNPDETGSVPIHDTDKANEVHAIDVDDNLRAGDLTMEDVVRFLLARCREGLETRLRYIIYNRRIWSASSGWVQKAYTGASPHTEHAHFSASYDSTLEASMASWHLEDLVALTDAEIVKIADTVWNRKFEDPYDKVPKTASTLLAWGGSRAGVAQSVDDKLAPRFATLAAAVASLDVIDDQELAQLAVQILAGLPAGLAERVAQETLDGMAQRLGDQPPAGA